MDTVDYNEIRNLVHEYAYRLDHGDVDGVGRLFADADVWFGEGSEPVRADGAAVARAFADWLQLYDGIPRTRHAMTNLQIWSDGPDSARATCYVMVFQQTPNLPLQPIIGGDYLDRFERHAGTWRFSSRVIRNDLFGDLSAHGRYRMPSAAPRPQTADLADKEAIRELKARQMRLLDEKNWQGLAALFCTNAQLRYDSGDDASAFEPAGFIAFLQERLVGGTSVHRACSAEIDLMPGDEARAVWQIEDRLFAASGNALLMHRVGQLREVYRRTGTAGDWLIAASHVERLIHVAS